MHRTDRVRRMRVTRRDALQIDGTRVLGRHHRTTALQRCTGPSRVDEDPSHDLRSQGEEVHAVVAVHFLCAGEPQIDLMNHCRALQRQSRSLLAHLAPRLRP